MSAIGRLCLLTMVLATVSAADTVITADEVIPCSVVSSDSSVIRLKMAGGGVRMLAPGAVYELRLADSARAADLAPRLPQVTVRIDSGQPIPSAASRADVLAQRRLARIQGLRAAGGSGRVALIDTVADEAPLETLIARCDDVNMTLCELGRSDTAALALRHQALWEAYELHGVPPLTAKDFRRVPFSAAGGALLGTTASCLAFPPPIPIGYEFSYAGGPGPSAGCLAAGCIGGGLVGLLGAVFARMGPRHSMLERHRTYVNGLIRRCNDLILILPDPLAP